jgi:hypothetical protein
LGKHEGTLVLPRIAGSNPASPTPGQLFYDLDDGTFRGWNGTAWVDLGAGGGGSLPPLQGDLLTRTPHAINAVSYFYVAPTGSDTNTGTQASPWLTFQGALNNLRDGTNGASWPSTGDVVLMFRAGTYQAASTAGITADIAFNNAARAPAADRWLIIKPEPGSEGQVVVKPPDGTNVSKQAIKTFHNGTSFFARYIQFRELIITGDNVARGVTNNDVIGIYINQTPNIDIIGNDIFGLVVTAGASSKAQGIYCDTASTDVCIWWNKVSMVGSATGTLDIQEHCIYASGDRNDIVGNVVHTAPNGYGIQFYDSGAAIADCIVAHNTVVGTIEKSCLVVPGLATGFKVANNIFMGATQYGIEFFPATFTGSGNEIHNNVYNGNTLGNRSHATPAGWTIDTEWVGLPRFVSTKAKDLRIVRDGMGLAHERGDFRFTPPRDLDGNQFTHAQLGAYAAILPKAATFGGRRWISLFNDFLNDGSTTASADSPSETVSGTGAASSQQAGEVGALGIQRFTTGTTATGRAHLAFAASALRLSGGDVLYTARVRVPTLSTGTEQFQIAVGLIDTATAINQVDAVSFLYNEAAIATGSAASPNWQCFTASNSTRTFTTTGIVVTANQWYTLELRVNAAGTIARFFIDGILVAVHTANIPIAAGRELGAGALQIKSVGTTARTFDIDYMGLEADVSGDR